MNILKLKNFYSRTKPSNGSALMIGFAVIGSLVFAQPFSRAAQAQSDGANKPIYVIPDANNPDYPGMDDATPDGESETELETDKDQADMKKTPVYVIEDANDPQYPPMKEKMVETKMDDKTPDGESETELSEEKEMAEKVDVTSTKGCQMEINKRLGQDPIQFLPGRYRLSKDSVANVKDIAAILNNCKDAKIVVAGHTDSSGNPAANQRLSGQRAKSILDLFVKNGVKKSRLRAVGYGASKPLHPNDSEENKALNRRIELELY